MLSGLLPFASPEAYHCTNTTLLGGSTAAAAAAITLGPRLRLRLPKQLLKLAGCWLLQPEKRAVSPFQRCQDRGKTVHLAKSLFCHSRQPPSAKEFPHPSWNHGKGSDMRSRSISTTRIVQAFTFNRSPCLEVFTAMRLIIS